MLGNRKRSEHIYLRHLRVRRPKIRALIVVQKYCRIYDAAKWALDRLGVDTVDVCRLNLRIKGPVFLCWHHLMAYNDHGAAHKRACYMSGVRQR